MTFFFVDYAQQVPQAVRAMMRQGQNMPREFYDAKCSGNEEPELVLPPLSPISQRFWSLPVFDRERIVQRMDLGTALHCLLP
jgi:hypothetical protein